MTVTYVNGFETGDASEINALGAGATVQTSTVHAGGYALKQAATFSQLLSGGSTTPGTGFYFRFPALPGADTLFLFAHVGGPTGDVSILTLQTDGKVVLAGGGTSTTALNINTWYLIQFAMDGAAGGVRKLWIDGGLEVNTTSAGTSALSNFSVKGPASPNEFFFDDFIVIDSATQPPSGIVIARQPVTGGTPTYNQFTKSTGTDAGALWDNTPFTTADNCTDATNLHAQTADIADFSSTQSGHGTETIGASDTINACKACIIEKTSATSSSGALASIRRRVNGTDTDTAITLTTVDTLYSDGFWTASTANLDILQVGAVHGNSTRTHTVEDVWVMVHYLAAVVATPALSPGGGFNHIDEGWGDPGVARLPVTLHTIDQGIGI